MDVCPLSSPLSNGNVLVGVSLAKNQRFQVLACLVRLWEAPLNIGFWCLGKGVQVWSLDLTRFDLEETSMSKREEKKQYHSWTQANRIDDLQLKLPKKKSPHLSLERFTESKNCLNTKTKTRQIWVCSIIS